MPSDTTTIRLTEERKDTLSRLKWRTGENTNTGALFVAARHYLHDYERQTAACEDTPLKPVSQVLNSRTTAISGDHHQERRWR